MIGLEGTIATKASKSGFTLIEVIIDAFVITAVFGAIIGTFLVMLRATDSGRIRTLATALANEQMEYLRNLPYDSLSTQNGTILPHGAIPDTQTVTRGGSSFVLETTITFVDDQFDGCAIPSGGEYVCTDATTSPNQDVVPVDYKRIDVQALKEGTPTVLVKLSSNAAAKAAETPSNTGMILAKIINAQGQPVAGATVTITNTANGTSVQGITNDQGYVFVANLLPDNQNGYHIVATKEGFSTDSTTSRTSPNPNQIQPDVDVNIQQVTIQTLAIDQLSTLAVTVTDQSGTPLSGVALSAISGKLTAFNPDAPKNTYNTNSTGSGLATFSNIEWDSYTVTVPSGYFLVNISPYQPVSVNPNTTRTVTLVLTTNSSWPQIESISPTAGVSGTTVQVTITGDNFESNTTVLLRLTGQADINPTAIDVAPNQQSLTATFNLTAAAAGNWNIVLNSNGNTVTQIEGFIIS